MSDLIDRQVAISAICNACGKIDCGKMDKCEKLQLPPANCSEFPNNSDTISRQAAIDLIESIETERLKGNIELIYAPAIKGLRALPPAQPEIIRCKDCKYGILDCDFPHERYCNFKGNDWNNDDHFCGHAKRREVTT